MIGYDHVAGGYTPFHLEDELGPDNCVHGEKGCTSCTRACPRFRLWEHQANDHLFGRDRRDDEVAGIYSDILLCRASDDMVHQMGQDGGLVSAISAVGDRTRLRRRRSRVISRRRRHRWKAVPGVASTRDEILAAAGSRYTYSANTLALDDALEQGHTRLALVGMSCQSSVPPTMWSRKIGKISKPIVFNIGLLCSKTFDDAIFEELFWAKYGLSRAEIAKMNIKGVFQIWMRDGTFHEINLKECHAWTRDGCNHCPDFAAEHADISTGGIGKDNDWTLTIVRTELGREIMARMVDDGSVVARPGDSDPGAIALMHKLAEKSRSRWPADAEPSVRVGLSAPSRQHDHAGDPICLITRRWWWWWRRSCRGEGPRSSTDRPPSTIRSGGSGIASDLGIGHGVLVGTQLVPLDGVGRSGVVGADVVVDALAHRFGGERFDVEPRRGDRSARSCSPRRNAPGPCRRNRWRPAWGRRRSRP